MSCCLVETLEHSGGAYCLDLQVRRMEKKMGSIFLMVTEYVRNNHGHVSNLFTALMYSACPPVCAWRDTPIAVSEKQIKIETGHNIYSLFCEKFADKL